MAAGTSYAGLTNVTNGLLQADAPNALSPNSSVSVDARSVLNVNGYSQTVGALANAGTVILHANGTAAGATLTVASDYAGQGGTLALNASLSGKTADQLVVQGSTSGQTLLTVNTVGGLGAPTSGNGIRLVQVNGASDGVFRLAQSVTSGAYDYLLHDGGVGASADDGDWYLRSTYRTTVPAYLLTPELNAEYGFDVLGTLHQRVGDAPGAVTPAGMDANGVWGRVGGRGLNLGSQSLSADSTDIFFQFGKDWTLAQPSAGGSTHAGVTVTLGQLSASFHDAARGAAGLASGTGTARTDAQSVGGYWTVYRPDGAYSDTSGAITRYADRYRDATGVRGSQQGYSVGVSEEVGKPLDLGRVTLEPQAQILYQYLNLNGFDDAIGAVSGTSSNVLRGRLGVRLYPSSSSLSAPEQKGLFRPYLQADVLHDFVHSGGLTVYGSELSPSINRTWFDVGVGVSAAPGANQAFYASVSYLHDLGGRSRDGFQANLGYRYQW